MPAASVLAAFIEHILTAVASPSPATTMAPPMTPAPTPPLAELTPVAQFQTSSSALATIVFFQQLTTQVCFITFSIAQPQFQAGLQLNDELFRKEGRSVVDSFIGQQYNRKKKKGSAASSG
jgi:hypothetical protein